MLGIARDGERAATRNLEVALAVQGSLLVAACCIGKEILRAFVQNQVNALAAFDVDGSTLVAREVEPIQVEPTLERPVVIQRTMRALSLQHKLQLVLRVGANQLDVRALNCIRNIRSMPKVNVCRVAIESNGDGMNYGDAVYLGTVVGRVVHLERRAVLGEHEFRGAEAFALALLPYTNLLLCLHSKGIEHRHAHNEKSSHYHPVCDVFLVKEPLSGEAVFTSSP